MLRKVFAAVAALALGVSAAAAEEIKGTVKKVDAAGNKLTLTVDSKDTVYNVAKDASFVAVSKAKGKKKNKTMEKVENIDNGLAGVAEGSSVTVLTDKDAITSVKVTSTGKATKNKKKAKKADKTSADQFVSTVGDKAGGKHAKGHKHGKHKKHAKHGKKKGKKSK